VVGCLGCWFGFSEWRAASATITAAKIQRSLGQLERTNGLLIDALAYQLHRDWLAFVTIAILTFRSLLVILFVGGVLPQYVGLIAISLCITATIATMSWSLYRSRHQRQQLLAHARMLEQRDRDAAVLGGRRSSERGQDE